MPLALKGEISPDPLTVFSSSLTPQSFNSRGIDTHFTVVLLDTIRTGSAFLPRPEVITVGGLSGLLAAELEISGSLPSRVAVPCSAIFRFSTSDGALPRPVQNLLIFKTGIRCR
ncbi:hypothetical protein PIB30_063421 [Stylosanthes scabra]|uniref:Uncharacterized protein n=1 Tax=Stylosanthes scabra TaxID=79078 RepID=A0ABU6UNM2_9FABA|nr:hypothetical protein [Stylosanthes scabra]